MIIGASGGSAPEWLETSRAPPVGGHVLDPLGLDPEPVAVVEVEQRVGERHQRAPSAPSRRARAPRSASASSSRSSLDRQRPSVGLERRRRGASRARRRSGRRPAPAAPGPGRARGGPRLDRAAEQRAVGAHRPPAEPDAAGARGGRASAQVGSATSSTSRRRRRRRPSTVAARLGLAAQDRERDRAARGGEHGGADRARPRARRARSGRRAPTGPARREAAQVAVRLALVVEARDRLLADVAALGEADGALVDPRLLAASSRAPSRRRSAAGPTRRGRSRRPRSIGSAPAREQRVADRVGRRRRGTIRSTPRSVAIARHAAPSTPTSRCACSGRERRRRRRARCARGPDQREQRLRPRSASTSTSRPTLYMSRWPSDGGARPRPRCRSRKRSAASRRTRMSRCIWPLRSSSAA